MGMKVTPAIKLIVVVILVVLIAFGIFGPKMFGFMKNIIRPMVGIVTGSENIAEPASSTTVHIQSFEPEEAEVINCDDDWIPWEEPDISYDEVELSTGDHGVIITFDQPITTTSFIHVYAANNEDELNEEEDWNDPDNRVVDWGAFQPVLLDDKQTVEITLSDEGALVDTHYFLLIKMDHDINTKITDDGKSMDYAQSCIKYDVD